MIKNPVNPVKKCWLLYLVFALALLLSCQPSMEPQTQIEGDYFQLQAEYAIPDSFDALIPNPMDFQILEDSTVYISGRYPPQIVQTRPPFDTFEQLGRRGQGPGEYVNPASLGIHGNVLLYSDQSMPEIKSLQIDENINQIGNDFSFLTNSGREIFGFQYPYLALLNNNSPYVSLYRLTLNGGGELITKFLAFEDYYGVANRHSPGGNIQIDDERRIYVITTAPYIITVFQITENDSTSGGETVQVEKIASFDMQQFRDIDPWTEHKYDHLLQIESQREQLSYLTESFTMVHNFVLIERDRKKYLLIELIDPQIIETSQFLFHLIDLENGALIQSFISKMMVLDSIGDTVWFYESGTRENGKIRVALKLYRFLGQES